MKQKHQRRDSLSSELRLPDDDSRGDMILATASAVSSATNESCSIMLTSGMQSQIMPFKSFKLTTNESTSTPSDGLTNMIRISFEEFLPQPPESTRNQQPNINNNNNKQQQVLLPAIPNLNLSNQTPSPIPAQPQQIPNRIETQPSSYTLNPMINPTNNVNQMKNHASSYYLGGNTNNINSSSSNNNNNNNSMSIHKNEGLVERSEHSNSQKQSNSAKILHARNRSDPRSTRCEVVNKLFSNYNNYEGGTTAPSTGNENNTMIEKKKKVLIQNIMNNNQPQMCPNNSLILDGPPLPLTPSRKYSYLHYLLSQEATSPHHSNFFSIKRLQITSAAKSPSSSKHHENSNKPTFLLEETGDEYLISPQESDTLLYPSLNFSDDSTKGTYFESQDHSCNYLLNNSRQLESFAASTTTKLVLESLHEKTEQQASRINLLEEKLLHYKEELRSKQGICDLKDIQIAQLIEEKDIERTKKQKWKQLFAQTSQLAQEYRAELQEERRLFGVKNNNNNNSVETMIISQGNPDQYSYTKPQQQQQQQQSYQQQHSQQQQQQRYSKSNNGIMKEFDSQSYSQKTKQSPLQQTSAIAATASHHQFSEASTSCNSRHQDSTNTQSASLSTSEKSLDSYPLVTEFKYQKQFDPSQMQAAQIFFHASREHVIHNQDTEQNSKQKHRRSLTSSSSQPPQQNSCTSSTIIPSSDQLITRMMLDSMKQKFATLPPQYSATLPAHPTTNAAVPEGSFANRSSKQQLHMLCNKSFEDQTSSQKAQQARKYSREGGNSSSTTLKSFIKSDHSLALAARKPPRCDVVNPSQQSIAFLTRAAIN